MGAIEINAGYRCPSFLGMQQPSRLFKPIGELWKELDSRFRGNAGATDGEAASTSGLQTEPKTSPPPGETLAKGLNLDDDR